MKERKLFIKCLFESAVFIARLVSIGCIISGVGYLSITTLLWIGIPPLVIPFLMAVLALWIAIAWLNYTSSKERDTK